MSALIHFISPEAYAAAASGDLDFACDDEAPVDLDKAWHAVHYLVTGDSELRFLTKGTQLAEVSEPCEVHSPQYIADLHDVSWIQVRKR